MTSESDGSRRIQLRKRKAIVYERDSVIDDDDECSTKQNLPKRKKQQKIRAETNEECVEEKKPIQRRPSVKSVQKDNEIVKTNGNQGRKKKTNKVPVKKVKDESSSSSDEEWGELETVDGHSTESRAITSAAAETGIEIHIERPKTSAEQLLETEIRREIARLKREQREMMHKMHLLCFVSHLQQLSEETNNSLAQSLALSLLPDGYIVSLPTMTVSVAERFLKWLKSAFVFGQLSNASNLKHRIIDILECKCIESYQDLSLVLTTLLRAVGLGCRICMSCTPISRKIQKMDDQSKINTCNKKMKTQNKESPKKQSAAKIVRSYWSEYWDQQLEQWICIDPLRGTIDEAADIEKNVQRPLHYVLVVSNDGGVRDVTARYAQQFLSSSVRRLRTDSNWWTGVLKRLKSPANTKYDRFEDMLIHSLLLSRPRPTVLSEYKNHPLYVLKRDLLKFEAIYPPDVKSVDEIRDEPVYLRSDVHILHSKESWIKEARVIKPNEQAYKIVKARPIMNIPKDEQIERLLEVFGFWQTEPYIPKPAENGIVPRNEFGNVELFKSAMLPPGTVHVRGVPGLLAVARQMNIDCAPAMVGWEFHGRSSHPLLDGWVVCKEHSRALLNAWREEQQRKEIVTSQKTQQRALMNWKRLIKGVQTLQKVRRKFDNKHERAYTVRDEEHLEGFEGEKGEQNDHEISLAWPQCKAQFEVDKSVKSQSRGDF